MQEGVVSKVIDKHMGESKWVLNVENTIINNFGVLRSSETKTLDNKTHKWRVVIQIKAF